MNELIDYVEKAGFENMRERIEVASLIQREANTVMTILLAGAGTALVFAAKNDGENLGMMGAVVAVSLYLFSLAAILNWKCLGLIAYPACHNVPKNIYKPEFKLGEIREWELENLQQRIDQALRINEMRSAWLNRCRYAAVLTPIIAVIGWVLADPVAVVGLAVAARVAG